MPDVFLSYSREDATIARAYADAFAGAGLDVWWDATLKSGEAYDKVTETALREARVAVVLWSPHSVESRWVRAEATIAERLGTFMPVRIGACELPIMFELSHTADLSRWRGKTDDPAWRGFLDDVRRKAGQAAAARPADMLPPARAAMPLYRRPAGWIAAAAIVLAAGLAVFLLHGRAGGGVEQGRVAILPFDATNNTEIARTTARALTAQLGETLNSGEIPTVSDEDAAMLRGPDAAARLKALGVSLLFAGSVEADDKTVDIKIRLDDPVHHQTLWTGSASGSAAGIADLRAVIANTGTNMLACSNRALKPDGLTDLALLTRYFTACDLFTNHNDATGAANTFQLMRNLRAVIAGAPDFVPARTDLAKFGAYLAPTMPPAAAAAMRAEAAREADAALKLQPASPDAYLAKEFLLPPGEWAAREALLRKAVAIDPEWPHTNGFLAWLLEETGRMREAEASGGRAAAAQLQIDWRPFGGLFACDAGDFEPATDNMRALAASHPHGVAGVGLLTCLLDAGRYKEVVSIIPPQAAAFSPWLSVRLNAAKALASGAAADREAARQAALKLDASNPIQLNAAVELLGMIGALDDAFRLADSVEPGYPRSGATTAFLFTPPLRPMQRDPRFMRLAARLKLVQFWQSSGKWPDFCAEPSWPYDCKVEAGKLLGHGV